jgi:hypothetical protein
MFAWEARYVVKPTGPATKRRHSRAVRAILSIECVDMADDTACNVLEMRGPAIAVELYVMISGQAMRCPR